MTELVIDLWRHGPLEGPPALNGRTDVLPQADAVPSLASAIAQRPIGGVLSSPLTRCHQPALSAAAQRQVPCMDVPAFAEWHFGDWDGKSFDWLSANHGDALAQFWRAPHQFSPPGGESLAAFRTRVLHHWHDWVATAHGHWALVTHGGVIRIVLAEVLSLTDAQYAALLNVRLDYSRRTTVSVWRQDAVIHYQLHTLNASGE